MSRGYDEQIQYRPTQRGIAMGGAYLGDKKPTKPPAPEKHYRVSTGEMGVTKSPQGYNVTINRLTCKFSASGIPTLEEAVRIRDEKLSRSSKSNAYKGKSRRTLPASSIGGAIQSVRECKGLNTKQVAEGGGYSPGEIDGLETRQNIRLSSLARVSAVMGVKVSDIILLWEANGGPEKLLSEKTNEPV